LLAPREGVVDSGVANGERHRPRTSPAARVSGRRKPIITKSQCSAPTGVRLRVPCTMSGIDPALRQSIVDGTYVVDPQAVAGAIVGRLDDVRTARRLSRMLVAGKRDARAVRPEQDQPGPGADRA
jgi:hypothetical protein